MFALRACNCLIFEELNSLMTSLAPPCAPCAAVPCVGWEYLDLPPILPLLSWPFEADLLLNESIRDSSREILSMLFVR